MTNIFNPQGAPQVKATFYFGRNILGEYGVDSNTFAAFLSDSVTPHFPGFNYIVALGSWNGETEQCFILSFLMADSVANRGQCDTIAQQYCDRFSQDAVALEFTACQFAFISTPTQRAWLRDK
jgi:hypothetical protein